MTLQHTSVITCICSHTTPAAGSFYNGSPTNQFAAPYTSPSRPPRPPHSAHTPPAKRPLLLDHSPPVKRLPLRDVSHLENSPNTSGQSKGTPRGYVLTTIHYLHFSSLLHPHLLHFLHLHFFYFLQICKPWQHLLHELSPSVAAGSVPIHR